MKGRNLKWLIVSEKEGLDIREIVLNYGRLKAEGLSDGAAADLAPYFKGEVVDYEKRSLFLNKFTELEERINEEKEGKSDGCLINLGFSYIELGDFYHNMDTSLESFRLARWGYSNALENFGRLRVTLAAKGEEDLFNLVGLYRACASLILSENAICLERSGESSENNSWILKIDNVYNSTRKEYQEIEKRLQGDIPERDSILFMEAKHANKEIEDYLDQSENYSVE